MTHDIVRSLLTIHLDLSPAIPGTFDPTSMEPVALAQSYTLDATVATQSLVANDLADPAGTAEWIRPEPTEKSWTVTSDQFVLRANAVDGGFDATGKATNEDIYPVLSTGTIVFVAIMDAGSTTGDVIPFFGEAIITNYSQNGTIDEFHTYSITLTGVGELFDHLTIT